MVVNKLKPNPNLGNVPNLGNIRIVHGFVQLQLIGKKIPHIELGGWLFSKTDTANDQ